MKAENKKRVMIVDEHPLTREGVRSIIQSNDDFQVVGEVVSCAEAIEQMATTCPDVLVIDMVVHEQTASNQTKIRGTKEIAERHPHVKMITLSDHSDRQLVSDVLSVGADGCLLQDEAPSQLLKAMQKVLDGDSYLSAGVTQEVEKSQALVDHFETKVLKTKLIRPSVTHCLSRARITKQLEINAHKPLSIISAGAGYGKSIAVSQWLDASQRKCAWISIDHELNDLRTFLFYLVASLEKAVPGSMNETKNSISGIELPPSKDLLYILLGELSEIEEDIILVLDDFHKISEEKIFRVFDEWLGFPPPNIHLVIITRRDPPLAIDRLRLAGRMIELRMNELSFTKDEVRDLYQHAFAIQLSDPLISKLQEKTEGWILALSLASMVIRKASNTEELIENLEGNVHALSGYLLTEVLSTQRESIQDFLLMSSIFQRFCVEVFDHVFDHERSLGAEFVRLIDQSNIFLIGLDADKTWFRYHHLFQELLHEQLRKRFADTEIDRYHLKASRWFAEHKLLDEAMYHALAAGSEEEPVEIIKNHRLPLINEGHWILLDKLFANIPQSVVDKDAELMLVEAYLRFCYADHIAVGSVLEKMAPVMDQAGIPAEIHGEYQLYCAYVTIYLKNDPASSLNHMEVALRELPELYSEPRALAELFYALFSQIAGRYESARSWLEETISRSESFAPIRRNRLMLGMLLTSSAAADFGKVTEYADLALSLARSSQMKDSLGICLMMVGQFHLRQGRWEQSIPFFKEVLTIKYHVHTRSVEDSFAGLVIANHLLGRAQRCKELLFDYKSYAADLGEHHKKFVWSIQARYAMLTNQRDDINDLLSSYTQDFLHLVFWFDVPEITYIRALIFEGSEPNLKLARNELDSLVQAAKAQSNRIHLLELYAIEAVYSFKVGDLTLAKSYLERSIAISEAEHLTEIYVEMYYDLKPVFNLLPDYFKDGPFLSKIEQEANHAIRNQQRMLTDETGRNGVAFQSLVKDFTQKELEVLGCVAEGLRNKEIADKLFNSEETIKKHIYNMFQKLHVKNRLNLVAKARKEGILEI